MDRFLKRRVYSTEEINSIGPLELKPGEVSPGGQLKGSNQKRC